MDVLSKIFIFGEIIFDTSKYLKRNNVCYLVQAVNWLDKLYLRCEILIWILNCY